MYANVLHIPPPRLQKRASRVCLSALHIYSDEQLVEATWLRAIELVFSHTYGSQMHWKWDETVRYYRVQWTEPRNRGTERISCYERRKLISQVRRPQRPQQLSCWEKMKTLMFILTSHSACETFWDAWDSLKRGENEGQRNCWGRKLKQCRAVNQPPWPGPPKYDVTLWWKSKRQA